MQVTLRTTTQTMRARDLDSGAILAACQHWIPVNTNLGAAITAHQIAYSYLRAKGGEDHKDRAARSLRAVVLAMAPETADLQQQLDYLSGLPIEAWNVGGGIPAADVRRATLAAISRLITWRAER